MSPRIPIAVLTTATAALVLLAGCGTQNTAAATTATAGTTATASTTATTGGGTPSMPGMTMSAPPSSAPQAPVSGNAVDIQNFAFAPATLSVKVGTKVTWTNKDQDPHTVVAKGGQFKSEVLNTGASYSFTFTTAGTYDYLCSIHPFMVATVVVTA